MANQTPQPDRRESRVDDDIEELLRHANPNPERAGCPPREVLSQLARRERPIADPAYDHLTECSPCYREFRELQQAEIRRAAPGRSLAKWLIPAAAALAVVAAGLWFLLSREASRGGETAPELMRSSSTHGSTCGRSRSNGVISNRLRTTHCRCQAVSST